MDTSLESLVKNLSKESLNNLSRFYKDEKFNLLMRKGVFPYDWFDHFHKLSSTQLLPNEAFYSKPLN